MNHNFNLKAIEFQIISEIRCDANGKIRFTIRAVARMCGISDMALRSAFQGADISPSKLAQLLMQHGFSSADILAFGHTGIPDIAVALIIQYYAMLAGERCTETAKQFLSAFLAIGIRAYGQQLIGYKNDNVDDIVTAIDKLLQSQLPQQARPHETRYEKRFWDALEKCYGLKKGQLACGKFIKTYVYRYFPPIMVERLEAINPLLEDGIRRQRCHHQHFDSTLLSLLLTRIDLITNLLEVAQDKKDFKRLAKRSRPLKLSEATVRALLATSS